MPSLSDPGYFPGLGGWYDPHWPGRVSIPYARVEAIERSTRETPDPIPWAVAFLVSAVSSKVAAANMTNKTAAQQIIVGADQAITAFIDSDDICPRWPLPGPPPWLSIIASELTLVANTLQDGALRTGILQVAGQVLDRVALNPQPLNIRSVP
jgi:hypothetical protein